MLDISTFATDTTETFACRRSRGRRVGDFAASWPPKINNKTEKRCVTKVIWLGQRRWQIPALALRRRGRRGGAWLFFGFRGWGGRGSLAGLRRSGGRDRS